MYFRCMGEGSLYHHHLSRYHPGLNNGGAKITKRVIEHEIRLGKSVKIVLAALAFGVLAHAFAPVFHIKDALADGQIISGSLTIFCKGCN